MDIFIILFWPVERCKLRVVKHRAFGGNGVKIALRVCSLAKECPCPAQGKLLFLFVGKVRTTSFFKTNLEDRDLVKIGHALGSGRGPFLLLGTGRFVEHCEGRERNAGTRILCFSIYPPLVISATYGKSRTDIVGPWSPWSQCQHRQV